MIVAAFGPSAAAFVADAIAHGWVAISGTEIAKKSVEVGPVVMIFHLDSFEQFEQSKDVLLKRTQVFIAYVDYFVYQGSGSINHHNALEYARNSIMSRQIQMHLDQKVVTIDRPVHKWNELGLIARNSLRTTWESYFMSLAWFVAKRTNCLKRRVGAVVVKDKRVISSGYNGAPAGWTNCIDGGCARCSDSAITRGVGLDQCCCIHAEANALYQLSKAESEGADIYVTTHPCQLCTLLLVSMRVRRIYYVKDYESIIDYPEIKKTIEMILLPNPLQIELQDIYCNEQARDIDKCVDTV